VKVKSLNLQNKSIIIVNDGVLSIHDLIVDGNSFFIPEFYKDDASTDEYRPRYSRPLDSGEGQLRDAAPDKDYLTNGYLKLDKTYYQVFIYLDSVVVREVTADDDTLLTIEEWEMEKEAYRNANKS